MKRILLVLFFYTTLTNIKAQSWCPNIGAYWYYTVPYQYTGSDYYSGYVKYDYVKDSLINGHNCQMLNRYMYYNWNVAADQGQNEAPVFTYTTASGVVFLNNYTSTASVQTQTFDTLFCFNVAIGTKWMFPHYCSGGYPTAVITVADTGHRQIQGINLKWQKVTYNALYGGDEVMAVTDTIYERFGFLNTNPLNPGSLCSYDDKNQLYFRCYGDNQMVNFKYGHSYNCDYVTGLNDLKTNSKTIAVFPNPAASFITIDTGAEITGDCIIELKDVLGNTVLRTGNPHHIDISLLLPGMYFVTLKNHSIHYSGKLIKQ